MGEVNRRTKGDSSNSIGFGSGVADYHWSGGLAHPATSASIATQAHSRRNSAGPAAESVIIDALPPQLRSPR
jgi:hypothetical protein